MSAAQLYGLVLAGGRSRRMQSDKAVLQYDGQSQLARAMALLAPQVERCFVSIRPDQRDDPRRAAYEAIEDLLPDRGPIGGIHAALHTHLDKAWLVLACDLPFLDAATLGHLIATRASTRLATAYRSSFDALPEPLCAIYEPASGAAIAHWIGQGQLCPRAFLAQADALLLDPIDPHALDNVNTPEQYHAAITALSSSPPIGADPVRIKVRYFAILREHIGRSEEELQTCARTALELYQELRRRHHLVLDPQFLRVAINDEFGDWRAPLSEGDTVAFLPPVAGG